VGRNSPVLCAGGCFLSPCKMTPVSPHLTPVSTPAPLLPSFFTSWSARASGTGPKRSKTPAPHCHIEKCCQCAEGYYARCKTYNTHYGCTHHTTLLTGVVTCDLWSCLLCKCCAVPAQCLLQPLPPHFCRDVVVAEVSH
jgi:hypothetical protein